MSTDVSEDRNCEKCGAQLQPDQVYSFKGDPLCSQCFFGESGLGPLNKSFAPCPSCGEIININSIKCCHCGSKLDEKWQKQKRDEFRGRVSAS